MPRLPSSGQSASYDSYFRIAIGVEGIENIDRVTESDLVGDKDGRRYIIEKESSLEGIDAQFW